jgi:hypothetical protein
LRASSSQAAHPILDLYPFATTSPIYVRAGDQPVRSPDDLAYFLKWIDRVREASSGPYHSEAEKKTTFGFFDEAKRSLRDQCGG